MAGSHPSTIGKYTVLSVLGRGGMGIVYKARDPIIDRIVAIKTISVTQDLTSAELRKRLQMEAQSAGRLQHPNIATLYDYGTFGDTPYIVMEYVEGTDLARVIEQKMPLSLPQKVDILIQIAHGLAYAHELDVVHRDMKPSNIRLTNRCVAKIIDFGLARFDSTRLTKTGFMSGTIAYMSPERIHGNEGASDDIFALGTIAYELLTGTRAFPGTTPPEVMMKIISQSPPLPSTVALLPPELDAIVMKGLAREVSDRYATAAALAEAFAEFRHAPALRAFLAKEPGAGEYAAQTQPGRANAITLTFPADADEASTAIMTRSGTDADETAVEPLFADTQLEAPATQVGSYGSAAPTTIEPRPMRRRSFIGGAIGAAILIAAAVAFLLPRIDADRLSGRANEARPVVPPPIATTETPAPAGSAAPHDVIGQRLLLTEVQNDLQSLRLDANERARFTAAQAEAAKAEAKYQEKDYQTTAELLSSALRVMQEVRRDHYQRLSALGAQATLTVAPEKSGATLKRSGRATSPSVERERKAADPPPPIAKADVAAQPKQDDRSPTTPERPPVDPALKARSEIAAFVGRLAKAYETRDVAFFREHDVSYNDRLATAIRNSPSVSVQIEIDSIELSGSDRARVKVVRTDRFAARNMPPGVQRVNYELARSGDQWKIVSMSRDIAR